MERRFLAGVGERALAVEERADGPPSVQGYCAVYYDEKDPGTQFELWPGTVERILPGAFHESLRDDADVRCFFNHDPNMILGRTRAGTLTLADFAKGLRYTCKLPDTTVGRDVATSIRRGDVSGSSFAFTVLDGGEAWVNEGDLRVRLLTRLRLHDASPVCVPAYEATTATARAAGDLAEVRQSQERWAAEQKRLADLRAKHERYRAVAERAEALARG